MNSFESLYLSRQFILSPEEVKIDFDSKKFNLPNGYELLCHTNLQVTFYTQGQDFIYILGNIFSALDIEATYQSIAKELLFSETNELLNEKIKFYSGRYVIIRNYKNEFLCFNDASAHRKIYYSTHLDKVWCASQPHILAKLINVKEQIEFFKSAEFLQSELCGILDKTPYHELRQLTPGKVLNVNENSVKRFWPNKKIVEKPIDEVLNEASTLLSNVMQNAALANSLMLPVTAGRDSRLLMSATKHICKNIFYYTNKNSYECQDGFDIIIPKQMFAKLGLDYSVICYNNDSPEDFWRIIQKNITFPYKKYNHLLYNVYYKNYSEKLNMPGICGEITYKWANRRLREVNGKELAKFYKFKGNEYVEKVYQDWIDEVSPVCHETQVPLLTIFFLEEIISNWAINVAQMKDIAQDEFYPLNFTALQELFYSANIKYRDYHSNRLFKELVKYMWPEISGFKYNPALKEKIFRVLKILHLYNFTTRIWALR